MKYRKAYDGGHTIACATGDGHEDVYSYVINEKGKVLKKTGRNNVYALIQEALDETLIENIMKRATAGDTDVLHKYAGQYFDSTLLPSSIAEAQIKINDIKEEFYGLPIEQRALFSNNAEIYVGEWGTEPWFKKMGYLRPVITDEKTEERGEVKKHEE